jgi:hypothetical protein
MHDDARRRYAPLQKERAHHLDPPLHQRARRGLGQVERGFDQEDSPRLTTHALSHTCEFHERRCGRLRLLEGQLGEIEREVPGEGFHLHGHGIRLGRRHCLISCRDPWSIFSRQGGSPPILLRQGRRRLILQGRLDGRLAKGAAQQPGFRPRDLRRGTRFGERRPLTGNVREVLHLSARSLGAGGGLGLFQRALGQIQLGRRQGAYAGGAARALDRGVGVIEGRIRPRAGTRSDRQRQEAGEQG